LETFLVDGDRENIFFGFSGSRDFGAGGELGGGDGGFGGGEREGGARVGGVVGGVGDLGGGGGGRELGGVGLLLRGERGGGGSLLLGEEGGGLLLFFGGEGGRFGVVGGEVRGEIIFWRGVCPGRRFFGFLGRGFLGGSGISGKNIFSFFSGPGRSRRRHEVVGFFGGNKFGNGASRDLPGKIIVLGIKIRALLLFFELEGARGTGVLVCGVEEEGLGGFA
jgi:hypothetical protein